MSDTELIDLSEFSKRVGAALEEAYDIGSLVTEHGIDNWKALKPEVLPHMKTIEQAARRGDTLAMILCWLTAAPPVFAVNMDRALQLALELVETDPHPVHQYVAGWLLHEKERFEYALAMFTTSAAGGYHRSNNWMAHMCLEGEVKTVGATEALRWYQSSIDAGAKVDYNYLGKLHTAVAAEAFENISGVCVGQKLLDAALERIKKDAERGDIASQVLMGRAYVSTGLGPERSSVKMVEWFNRAINQAGPNGASAEYALGCAYFNGDTVTKDQAMGKAMIISAAAHGSEEAKKSVEKMGW